MTNFLNLPNWEVGTVTENEHDYHVEATYKPLPETCPHCPPALFGRVYRHGTMKQTVMDLPSHGKRVGIQLTRVRLRCQMCNKTCLQPVPDLDDRGTMTRRLVKYIEEQSLRKTFVAVADDVGLTEGTIRNLFGNHVLQLEAKTQFQTPERLGIDELFLIKKPRAVFTNLKEKTIIGVLDNRLKKSVTKHLLTLDAKAVKVVAIDMHRAYKEAVQDTLPNAAIVVDKFHVVRMASQCLEAVRKSFRESLDDKTRRKLMHDRWLLLKRNKDLKPHEREMLASWEKAFPKIGDAYRIKECFFGIWDSPDVATAKALFKDWEAMATTDPEMTKAYKPLLTALRNWEPEILAHFEHDETNAVTEALNGIVRHIERNGRGYSFDVMRARMLFGAKVQKRPKFGSSKVAFMLPDGSGPTYGASVDLLLKELEAENPNPTPADSEQEEGE